LPFRVVVDESIFGLDGWSGHLRAFIWLVFPYLRIFIRRKHGAFAAGTGGLKAFVDGIGIAHE
jgi:hypothetical protein